MFRLSTRSRYGVRALIELAQAEDRMPLPIALISSRQKIPRNFLEQILYRLNRAGIVESVRGPSGGYRLKKSPQELKLSEIVNVLEKPAGSIFCLGDPSRDGNCGKNDCFSSFLCRHLDRKFNETLDKITLVKMAKEWKRNKNA